MPDRAMVITTKAMVRDRRLELEKNSFSSRVRIRPIREPRSREPTISSRGSTRMDSRLTLPECRAVATPKDTAKATRPTASSRATMGSSRSVSLPLALYCRTTIRVAAGAVAVAMAPRVMAAGALSTSGISRCRPSRAASTSTMAIRACSTPMTAACLPVSFSWDRRNSLPMEKAMKPRATEEMTLRSFTASNEEKPRPPMCSDPSP